MNKNRLIAIILADTLQAIGIHSLLSDFFPQFSIRHFQLFSLLENSSDNFDFYITDSSTYVCNLDYFLLRRNKTLVLTTDKKTDAPSSSPYFLPVGASMETLIECLENVFTVENPITLSDSTEGKELSMREIDVLKEIVRGGTNKEIADHLNISLNTVLSHRKNITTKLGIKTVPGLTFYAIMNGIISGNEIDT